MLMPKVDAQVCMHRVWVVVTSSSPLKVYLFDGGVVIFGSVNKKRTDVDMPADDEVLRREGMTGHCSLYSQPINQFTLVTLARSRPALLVVVA